MWRLILWTTLWITWLAPSALALPPTPAPATPTRTPVIRPTSTPVPRPTTPVVISPTPTPVTQTGIYTYWVVTVQYKETPDGPLKTHSIQYEEGADKRVVTLTLWRYR